MDRMTVIERAHELGYEHVRDTKHSELYEQTITGARVGIPHTPSDVRSLKNTLAELERGAVTNGKGTKMKLDNSFPKDSTVMDAVPLVLKAYGVPMKTSEIAEAVLGEIEASYSAVTVALSTQNKRDAVPVVRLKKGWFVYDEELHEIPAQERRTAIDRIAKAGPRRAYREPGIRSAAITAARKLLEPEPPPPEPETRDEPTRAAGTGSLMEMLAVDDERGVAFMRDEGGRLWTARRVE